MKGGGKEERGRDLGISATREDGHWVQYRRRKCNHGIKKEGTRLKLSRWKSYRGCTSQRGYHILGRERESLALPKTLAHGDYQLTEECSKSHLHEKKATRRS